MRLWIFVFNPPAAQVFVWAEDEETARDLALKDIAEKRPGADPQETYAAELSLHHEQPHVVTSIITG